MIPILSCDWGTSSFRISLVDPEDFTVIATQSSDQGNLKTFNAWKDAGALAEKRTDFYLNIITEHIRLMEKSLNGSLDQVPVIISGMASSTIGILPLPYQRLPFAINGSDVGARHFPATNDFRHEILLISGVQSEDDVMRGEETQLIGCIPPSLDPDQSNLFIFPGTHSKHITVHNGFAIDFRTFMTGEFFDLLSTKSILAAGMTKEVDTGHFIDDRGFEAGVKDAVGSNLLHASFKARTNSLFDILSASENFSYLSGLLIGYELQELAGTDPNHIYLCCGNQLKANYEKALELIGIKNAHSLDSSYVQAAAIRGQFLVYDKFKQHA